MLITFTQSGSLFNVDFQFDSFNQGDNNTHIVDVVVLDESFSNYEYSAYIQFIREGDKLPSDKFIMANKRIVINGVAYNGYTFKMNSDWFTAVAGVLKATIEIKKFNNGVMESNKAYGIVNIPVQASVSAISEVDSKITNEEYISLVDLINSKFNKDDYDIEDLGYLDTNEDEAIKTAIRHKLSNYSNSNIYKYTIPTPGGKADGIVVFGYDFSTMWAISISGNNIKSYEVDTTKNEVVLINRDVNVPQLNSTKANISNIKVNTNIEVPAPVGEANAVNKYYLNSNHYKKSDVDSKITDTKNYAYNLTGEAISVASSTAKHYYDESVAHTNAKFNEVKSVLDTILKDAPTAYDTLKEIADYIASDKTGASEMLAKINTNTLNIASLNANKLDKNGKVQYENVVNAPEKLDIILRSEVSPDTTEEVKEMEINGMKFKVGSATSGDSAIKGKLVASGTLEWNEDGSAYKRIYDFEERKLYVVSISDSGNYLGYCVNGIFDTPIIKDAWGDLMISLNQFGEWLNINNVTNDEALRSEWDGFSYEVYELVAPVGSGSGAKLNACFEPRIETHTIRQDGDGFYIELNGCVNIIFPIVIYNKRNQDEHFISYDFNEGVPYIYSEDMNGNCIIDGTLDEYAHEYILGGVMNSFITFIAEVFPLQTGDEVEIHYVHSPASTYCGK